MERFKVCLIGKLLHNRIYKGNIQNSDFEYLPFDGDERFISRQRTYFINDDIVFRLNNGSRVYI